VAAGFSTDIFGSNAGFELLAGVAFFGDSAIAKTEIKIEAAKSNNKFDGEVFTFVSPFLSAAVCVPIINRQQAGKATD
jgi:hypothetical protein